MLLVCFMARLESVLGYHFTCRIQDATGPAGLKGIEIRQKGK